MSGYMKPELVVVGEAIQTVHSLAKKSLANEAPPPYQPPATASAYEADE